MVLTQSKGRGIIVRISSIKKLSTKETVYDVRVKDHHNYILENGIISHNSGGGGVQYAPDVALILSKAKEKDGTKHIGAIITLRVDKSRWQPEGNKYKVILLFDKGIFKFSSMIDFATDFEIFKKAGTRIELPDGSKKFRKEIVRNPELYFTPDIMEKLQKAIQDKYGFGTADGDSEFHEFEEDLEIPEEE